ncbi:MAG: DUF2231 domain-containing protein [Syntrophomonadaceae bacterium]
MSGLPPLPSWDGLHPLIVHFPIALLFVAPLFVILGIVLRHSRLFLWAALLLMAMGTAATFFAVSTGEAAGKLADRTPQINAVLERHEELAETTRIVFTALTLVFAAIVVAPAAFRRLQGPAFRITLPLVFLLFYGAGVVVLTHTAHNGGRLVHELGVQALMPPSPAAEPVAREAVRSLKEPGAP